MFESGSCKYCTVIYLGLYISFNKRILYYYLLLLRYRTPGADYIFCFNFSLSQYNIYAYIDSIVSEYQQGAASSLFAVIDCFQINLSVI